MRARAGHLVFLQVDASRNESFIDEVMQILEDNDIVELAHLSGSPKMNYKDTVTGGKRVCAFVGREPLSAVMLCWLVLSGLREACYGAL